jgi:predicted DNA-binding WGR domain protein
MAALEATKKLNIYHTLYRLNLSFSNIVSHCRTLQEAGIFSAKSTRLFQGYAQELQAEMNQELLETMHQTELDDWGRFGKIRQAQEKRLRDPADVLIQAEEYKRSQRRKRKKKASTQRQRKKSAI